MSPWTWFVVVSGAFLLVYGVLLVALALAGRAGDARAFARFIPDCVVLMTRLARDPSLPRSTRWLVVALGAYLALPIDIVPDVLPVVGQLDDAILVALVLRRVVRAAGLDALVRHWPGPEASLRLVRSLVGLGAAT
ncbi:MAG: DUF1232 domain-containing protein [Actinobacteria bacterium]|nr:DUF1232 domain-containing protein [Actinomycetota bacterium]